jgi:DNA-binding transcriptional ArsR family regulator
VLEAARAGLIEAGDLLVLEALKQNLEWRACRAWAEIGDLAEATGLSPAEVDAALDRLISAGLVAVMLDAQEPSWQHWLLHPLIASNGRADGQQEAWARWREATLLGLRPGGRIPSRMGWKRRRRDALAAATTEQAAASSTTTTSRKRRTKAAAAEPTEQAVAA